MTVKASGPDPRYDSSKALEGNKFYLPLLNTLSELIHAVNVTNGWYEYDKVRDFDGQMMNVVTEVAEAQEEWRAGRGMDETYWTVKDDTVSEYELNDSLRIMDGLLYVRNYDYNVHPMDPHPQPGDPNYEPEWLEMTPDLLRNMPGMIKHLKPEGIPSELADIIIRVLDTCGWLQIDIAAAIADKMAYNSQRPHRHGGKRS